MSDMPRRFAIRLYPFVRASGFMRRLSPRTHTWVSSVRVAFSASNCSAWSLRWAHSRADVFSLISTTRLERRDFGSFMWVVSPIMLTIVLATVSLRSSMPMSAHLRPGISERRRPVNIAR